MGDYEEAEIEKLIGLALEDLVPEGQIGTDKVESWQLFNEPLADGGFTQLEAHDYIVIEAYGGYLDQDSYTNIFGVEISCWGKSRSRASKLSREASKRVLAMEGNTFDGWLIDHAEVLRGHEEDHTEVAMDDRIITRAYELHSRVKWL